MRHALDEAGTLVGDNVGHILSGKGVNDKKSADDHQGRAKGTASCLEEQDEADHGNNQIEGGRGSRTRRESGVIEVDVGG